MSDDQIRFDLDAPFEMAENSGYLEGRLLVSTPLVHGDIFSNAVIFLFAHNPSGAMGVIVNKPVENIHSAALLQQLGIKVSANSKNIDILHGGPLEEYRGFVMHSSDYKASDTIEYDGGISMTSSVNVIKEIAAGKGPEKHFLSVGYAGWAPGQLEAEIEANSWITIEANHNILFDTDHYAKFGVAAKSLGVDMSRFSTDIGHA